MAVEQFYFTPNRVIDQNGISDGASIYFYANGTTTLQTIYSDAARLTPMANPVVVPAGAAVPNIYLNPDLVYRARCVPSGGGDPIFDYDPYSGIAAGSIALPDGETITNYLNTMHMTYAEIATSKIPSSITRITVTDRSGAFFTRRASDPGYPALAQTQDASGAYWGLWQGQVITPWHFGATEEPWLTYAGVSSQAAIQQFFNFIADFACEGADVTGDFRTDGPVRLAPTSESGYVKTVNIVGLMRLRGGVNITNSMLPIGRVEANKAILSIDNIYPNAKAGGFIVSALGGADYNVRLTPCCIRLGAVARVRFTVLEGENAQIWNIWATDDPGVKNSNLMSVECLKGTKGGSGYDFAGRSHSGTVGGMTQSGVANSTGQRARISLSLFADLPPAALVDYANGDSRSEADVGGFLAGSSPVFIVFTSGANNGKIFQVQHVDYPGAAIHVYPWPSSATAPGDTFRWIFGGGICMSGADTNIWEIGKVETSNCGIGFASNMFYGPEIGMLHADAVGVALQVGGNQGNSSFGTKVASFYIEGCDTHILTSSINCDGVISNTFALDLAKCITTANAASALGVRLTTYPTLQRLKVGRENGEPITGIRSASNTVGSTAAFILNRPDQIETFEADTKTIEITVVPSLNAATGIDSCQVFVIGTGAAKEPTGTITFTAAGIAGITVTGGPFSGLTKPGHFVVRHDIAGNTLKITSLA